MSLGVDTTEVYIGELGIFAVHKGIAMAEKYICIRRETCPGQRTRVL